MAFLANFSKGQTVFQLPLSYDFDIPGDYFPVDWGNWPGTSQDTIIWHVIDSQAVTIHEVGSLPIFGPNLVTPYINTSMAGDPVIEFDIRIENSGTNCTPYMVLLDEIQPSVWLGSTFFAVGSGNCGSSTIPMVVDSTYHFTYHMPIGPETRCLFGVEFENGHGSVWLDNVEFYDANPSTSTFAAEDPVLVLAPNPCTDKLKVTTTVAGSFSLFDMEGRVLKSGSIDYEDVLDLGDVAPGIYFFRLLDQDGDEAWTKKITRL